MSCYDFPIAGSSPPVSPPLRPLFVPPGLKSVHPDPTPNISPPPESDKMKDSTDQDVSVGDEIPPIERLSNNDVQSESTSNNRRHSMRLRSSSQNKPRPPNSTHCSPPKQKRGRKRNKPAKSNLTSVPPHNDKQTDSENLNPSQESIVSTNTQESETGEILSSQSSSTDNGAINFQPRIRRKRRVHFKGQEILTFEPGLPVNRTTNGAGELTMTSLSVLQDPQLPANAESNMEGLPDSKHTEALRSNSFPKGNGSGAAPADSDNELDCRQGDGTLLASKLMCISEGNVGSTCIPSNEPLKGFNQSVESTELEIHHVNNKQESATTVVHVEHPEQCRKEDGDGLDSQGQTEGRLRGRNNARKTTKRGKGRGRRGRGGKRKTAVSAAANEQSVDVLCCVPEGPGVETKSGVLAVGECVEGGERDVGRGRKRGREKEKEVEEHHHPVHPTRVTRRTAALVRAESEAKNNDDSNGDITNPAKKTRLDSPPVHMLDPNVIQPDDTPLQSQEDTPLQSEVDSLPQDQDTAVALNDQPVEDMNIKEQVELNQSPTPPPSANEPVESSTSPPLSKSCRPSSPTPPPTDTLQPNVNQNL